MLRFYCEIVLPVFSTSHAATLLVLLPWSRWSRASSTHLTTLGLGIRSNGSLSLTAYPLGSLAVLSGLVLLGHVIICSLRGQDEYAARLCQNKPPCLSSMRDLATQLWVIRYPFAILKLALTSSNSPLCCMWGFHSHWGMWKTCFMNEGWM